MAATLFVGCGSKIVLHLIDQQDIIALNKGEAYKAPRDGYFVSDYYVEKIMQAKVN